MLVIRKAAGNIWHCWCLCNHLLSSPVKVMLLCFDEGNEARLHCFKNASRKFCSLLSCDRHCPGFLACLLSFLFLPLNDLINIPLFARVSYLRAVSRWSLLVWTCRRVPKNAWIFRIMQKYCSAFIIWTWWEIRECFISTSFILGLRDKTIAICIVDRHFVNSN